MAWKYSCACFGRVTETLAGAFTIGGTTGVAISEFLNPDVVFDTIASSLTLSKDFVTDASPIAGVVLILIGSGLLTDGVRRIRNAMHPQEDDTRISISTTNPYHTAIVNITEEAERGTLGPAMQGLLAQLHDLSQSERSLPRSIIEAQQ